MSETLNLEAGATRQITDKEAMKVSIGALIGTAMEWYDFFLFSAAAALVFNVQYFANENATAAALASFATFGVGLVARSPAPASGMRPQSLGESGIRGEGLGRGFLASGVTHVNSHGSLGPARRAPVLLVS